MRKYAVLIILLVLSKWSLAGAAEGEQSIRHLKVDEIESIEVAIKKFYESTAAIKNKKLLNSSELHEIHVITYTLEKSIQFFINNLSGESQVLAENAAIIVENIHIASENNRRQSTVENMREYFQLADQLALRLGVKE
ncbi:DUF6746 family protein [uncultured Oceanicoccus sp.]|uniref:DUF6746 family protein n=1 Tax=uncultured Oceanicoccus sp. TaxID=1706381 RepID=UPI0030DB36A7